MASATADAEPRDRVGFKRAEMFSEPLYGVSQLRCIHHVCLSRACTLVYLF